MRAFVNPANAITSASLSAGFLAVLLAADGRLALALAAVALAAVLDVLDGIFARRLASSGPFGCQLDSLADLVAFGVAPALMLHEGVVRDVPVLGPAACVAFVVAGAWRLARYPLVEHLPHFVGVPIPFAGLIVGATAVLGPPAALALAVVVALAVGMVSALRFPSLVTLTRLAVDASPVRPARRRNPHARRPVRRRLRRRRERRRARATPGRD